MLIIQPTIKTLHVNIVLCLWFLSPLPLGCATLEKNDKKQFVFFHVLNLSFYRISSRKSRQKIPVSIFFFIDNTTLRPAAKLTYRESHENMRHTDFFASYMRPYR